MNTEQETYFRNKWNNEIRLVAKIQDTKYYIQAYPLDQYECDTISIRVYKDNSYSYEKEYGNGLWIDSDMGIFNGNDELNLAQEVEDVIIDKVFNKLREKEII